MIILIDGNYILNKNARFLAKQKLLYGLLHRSLEKSINTYRTLFSFDKCILVADKGSSWRKSVYPLYKANRNKDGDDIDWEFIYTAWEEYKTDLPPSIKLIESDGVEGDDIIAVLCEKYNREGESCLIVTNDYDIKQLVNINYENDTFNIMTNEMFNREKVFTPHGFNYHIDKLSKNKSNDLFDLDDTNEVITFLKGFMARRDVTEISSIESILEKIVCGDKSDNINCVFKTKNKSGKDIGIGEAGYNKILKSYKENFGDVSFDDKDFHDNISDLICEYKKVSLTNLEDITKSIKFNQQLIDLTMIPEDIKKKVLTLV